MKYILIFIIIGLNLTLFSACSYLPETYNEQEYIAGTKFDSPKEWFDNFILSMEENTWLPSRSYDWFDDSPKNPISLKAPVAILLKEKKFLSTLKKRVTNLLNYRTSKLLILCLKQKHSFI